MLPMKLELTEKLAATLRQLRLDHPVDGEILTAENLSKAIGNNSDRLCLEKDAKERLGIEVPF